MLKCFIMEPLLASVFVFGVVLITVLAPCSLAPVCMLAFAPFINPSVFPQFPLGWKASYNPYASGCEGLDGYQFRGFLIPAVNG